MISIAKNIFIVFEKTIRLSADALIVSAVMSEKVCKILLVLALMLGVPQA